MLVCLYYNVFGIVVCCVWGCWDLKLLDIWMFGCLNVFVYVRIDCDCWMSGIGMFGIVDDVGCLNVECLYVCDWMFEPLDVWIFGYLELLMFDVCCVWVVGFWDFWMLGCLNFKMCGVCWMVMLVVVCIVDCWFV